MTSHRKTSSFTILAGAAALVVAGGIGAAFAQAGPMPGGPGGMGRGDGMRGPGGFICRSQESLVPRIAARLETTVKPTDAQKPEFDALRSAMTKAEGTLKAACPTEAELSNRTPPARLALAEKRMAAGLDAIRTVRPAFDAFYAKLDDKQRDQMRWMRGGMGMMGGRGGDQGHGWWQRQRG